MKATLNSFIDNNDKIKKYIAVCRQKGIEVLSPDVNKSGRNFEVDNSKEQPSIRFGLKGIKSLGAKSELIIAEREANGEFTSYQDFVKRMIGIPKFDKAAVEALIYAGALDEFEGTRKNKLEILETLEKRYKSEAVLTRNGQLTIFALAEELNDQELLDELKEVNSIDTVYTDNIEYNPLYKLDKEKEFTGFYITAHPIDIYKADFVKEGAMNIIDLLGEEEQELDEVTDDVNAEEEASEETASVNKNLIDTKVTVAGIIKEVEVRYTKKDSSKMKTFVIEDDTDNIRCVIFPKRLAEGRNDDLTNEKKIVLVSGTLKADESFGLQILVDTIKDIDTIKSKSKKCTVIFRDREKVKDIFPKLKSLSSKQGIEFVAQYKGITQKIGEGCLDNSQSNIDKIHALVGESNVIIE